MFAILVKSPNAAQSAVDMLLNIESAAIITSRIANKVNATNWMNSIVIRMGVIWYSFDMIWCDVVSKGG